MNLPAGSLITGRLEVLLALLFAGHVVADFLVQSGFVAQRKHERTGVLIRHGALTFLCQALFVWPFWNAAVLAGVAVITILHVLIDGLKLGAPQRWLAPLPAFLLDQMTHAAVIVLTGLLLWHLDRIDRAWFVWSLEPLVDYGRWNLIAAGFVFNGKGGTAVVRKLLERYPRVLPRSRRRDGSLQTGDLPPEDESPAYAMGRTIGVLERLLLYTLVLLGQWSALGFVVAAKSIARFRELDSKRFADYYLIGTLTSLLVAIATGIVVRYLVGI